MEESFRLVGSSECCQPGHCWQQQGVREHRRFRESPAHTSGSSQGGFPAATELEWAGLMIDLMFPGEKARVAPFPMYRHDS